MIEVDFNPEQLKVGESIVKNTKTITRTTYKDLNTNLDNIVSAANDYKVNLNETIDLNAVEDSFEDFEILLADMDALAHIDYGKLEDYEKGYYQNSENKSAEDILYDECMNSSDLLANPSAVTRGLYTLIYGQILANEAAIGYFADIIGCAVGIHGGIFGMVGKGLDYLNIGGPLRGFFQIYEDNDNTIVDFLSTNHFENDSLYKHIRSKSFFGRDSIFGNICTTVGEAAAAFAGAEVGATLFTAEESIATKSVTKSGASKATGISDYLSGVFSKKLREDAIDIAHTYSHNFNNNYKEGDNVFKAMIDASGETAKSVTKDLANDTITRGLSKKIRDSKVGDVIEKLDDTIVGKVGQKSRDVAVKAAKKAASIASSVFKDEVDVNVSGQKSEQSETDKVANEIKDETVDLIVGTGKKSVD